MKEEAVDITAVNSKYISLIITTNLNTYNTDPNIMICTLVTCRLCDYYKNSFTASPRADLLELSTMVSLLLTS